VARGCAASAVECPLSQGKSGHRESRSERAGHIASLSLGHRMNQKDRVKARSFAFRFRSFSSILRCARYDRLSLDSDRRVDVATRRLRAKSGSPLLTASHRHLPRMSRTDQRSAFFWNHARKTLLEPIKPLTRSPSTSTRLFRTLVSFIEPSSKTLIKSPRFSSSRSADFSTVCK
jgi:hypothetical protein